MIRKESEWLYPLDGVERGDQELKPEGAGESEMLSSCPSKDHQARFYSRIEVATDKKSVLETAAV